MSSAPSIRVGLALAGGATRAQLDDLCAALASATGRDVSGVGLWYYHRLLAAMDTGDVDLAWLPPILAAQALSGGLATPIALPIRGGSATYSTALFTREGSSVRSIDELRGARAAWVDRQSASGYLLIRAHLRVLGVDVDHAFASDQFLGSHEAVARAVQEGAADVGASFFHLDDAAGKAPIRPIAAWGDAPIRLLAHAGPIPADVIAANRRVDPETLRLVQHAFVDGRHDALRDAARALLGAEGFVAPLPAHLEPLMRLLPALDVHARALPSFWPRDR